MIPAVESSDMPSTVEAWCDRRDYSLHCEECIVYVEDNGNPLTEWMKAGEFSFDGKSGATVAILPT